MDGDRTTQHDSGQPWSDEAWQAGMRIVFDFNHLMAEAIGPAGFADNELEGMSASAQLALQAIRDRRAAGALTWMDLPYHNPEQLVVAARRIRERFRNFVVLGIGGSALGTTALFSALAHPYHNELPDHLRPGPRLYVLDNVDPDWLSSLLDVLDPRETCFNVITKSGSTAETMSQLLWARHLVSQSVGSQRYAEHFVATTDASQGSLRPLAEREGYQSFAVPDGVGGRFSVLSAVGLLPAAVVGIDVGGLLAGAAYMDRLTQGADLWRSPALMFALTQHAAYLRGRPMSVMMPYVQGLRAFADWYAQLWAESLGKAADRLGQTRHLGPTPIKALGATDQHSQVQLYVEGPRDKVFTFITADQFAHTLPIPEWQTGFSGIDYLGGHTFNELLAAEAEGTALALADAGQPNSTFRLPAINPFTIGQAIYLFEVATAISGELYDINAFDQPGVEAGKTRAYALLRRPGFEKERAAIEDIRARRKATYRI